MRRFRAGVERLAVDGSEQPPAGIVTEVGRVTVFWGWVGMNRRRRKVRQKEVGNIK